MICAALFDSMAIYSITLAFQADSSGFVALISYLSVVYSFVADKVIFNEQFNAMEMTAALSIFIVTISIVTYKLCKAQKTKQI